MIYVVVSNHTDITAAIVAPAGYSRRPDGTIYRDGTPSPEMGLRCKAYKFRSHRAAMRNRNLCGPTYMVVTSPLAISALGHAGR